MDNDAALKRLLKGNGRITVKVSIPGRVHYSLAMPVISDLIAEASQAVRRRVLERVQLDQNYVPYDSEPMTWVGSAVVPLKSKRKDARQKRTAK